MVDEPEHDIDAETDDEILVDLAHDPMLRHVVLSIHMGKKSEPAEYMEQIKMLVDEYGERPEELFATADLLDEFH